MSGFDFLKSFFKMIVFGFYPEYKSAKVKVFEKRISICYSCEFRQNLNSEYDNKILIKNRCIKGNLIQKDFDVFENAKYEKNNCPINKW